MIYFSNFNPLQIVISSKDNFPGIANQIALWGVARVALDVGYISQDMDFVESQQKFTEALESTLSLRLECVI